MKKLIILFISILFISSCTVYQDFYFEKDGSGKLEVLLDASSLIEMSKMYSTPDTSKKKKTEDIIFENLDKMDIDFKVSLFDILPDSIKEKAENPNALKGLNIIARNHKTNSKLGLQYQFFSIEELDKKLEDIAKFSSSIKDINKNKRSKLNSAFSGLKNINTKYSDMIKFKKGKIILYPSQKISKEDTGKDGQSMMTAMIKVQTHIYLPGKAKKGNYIIEEKKSVIFNDGKIGTINNSDKPVIIRYKRGWWDIF